MSAGPTWLSLATPWGVAEIWLRCRIDRARARRITGAADLGASVIEWVVISATLVLIAGAVGAVIMNKLKSKAESLDLSTPGGGAGGGNP